MNIFKLVNLLPKAMQEGEKVSNPEAWKKGQITAGILAGFLTTLLGVANAFGYEIPITSEQINYIAGGLLSSYGMYNIIATVVSTEKIGFKSNPKD